MNLVRQEINLLSLPYGWEAAEKDFVPRGTSSHIFFKTVRGTNRNICQMMSSKAKFHYS